MNERIQELAEQAGMYVDLDSKPWPKCMSAEEAVAAYEKFAQLIVRECIKQARKDENGLAYEAVGRIAEHFGVE
jgi:hypothetical protein